MMSPRPSANKWKDIPFELKEIILQNSVESARRALKACSKADKETVEKARADQIEKLSCSFSNRLGFTINKSTPEVMQKFENLENAENELVRILSMANSVKYLGIFLEVNSNCSLGIQRKIRAENVRLRTMTDQQTINILAQLEPGYLRSVELDRTIEKGSEIYDMPQIMLAEKLICPECSIQENQLMQLHATNLSLRNLQCPLKKYTEKCAAEAHVRMVQFELGSRTAPPGLDREKRIYKTSDPRINLEVQRRHELNFSHIESFTVEYLYCGLTKFSLFRDFIIALQAEPSTFKTLKSLSIRTAKRQTKNNNNCSWFIDIDRRNEPRQTYEVEKTSEMLQMLDEIIDCIDYIKSFKLCANNSQEFAWKPKKRITIESLEIGEVKVLTNILEFLGQIEPVWLRRVRIEARYKTSKIFDTPQIQKANQVEVVDSFCRDDQLLKMDAENFVQKIDVYNRFLLNDRRRRNFVSSIFYKLKCLVERQSNSFNGINQLLKKCVLHLDTHCFDLRLFPIPAYNFDEIFRDLDVIYSEPDAFFFTINSSHPAFVLIVHLRQSGVYIRRVRRERGTMREDHIFL